jgi:hypothetical protein
MDRKSKVEEFDYCGKQKIADNNITKGLDGLDQQVNKLEEVIDALRFVGNENLASRLQVITERISNNTHEIRKNRTVEIDNYMELDCRAQSDFIHTLNTLGKKEPEPGSSERS